MARKTQHRRSFGAVRKLASGRFQARYIDPTGQQRTAPRTFPTRTEADEWLAAARTDMGRNEWRSPDRGQLPLREFIDRWLAAPPRQHRASTSHLNRHLATRWICATVGTVTLGDFPLAGVTATAVREWHAQLLPATAAAAARGTGRQPHPARQWAKATGRTVPNTGRMSPQLLAEWEAAGRPTPIAERQKPDANAGRTIAAQTYRLLHAVLNTAVDEGLIDANPCRVAGAGSYKAPKRKPATVAEVQLLADTVPARYRAAVLLAAWSGLRAGELFALARQHVDLDGQRITVERQLVAITGQPVRFGPPKSDASVRTVTLPETIARALAEHMAEYVDPGDDALLFTTAGGGYVTSAVRSSWWNTARTLVGLPHLHWHDLRHTGQTLAAATGAGLPQLMQRMGHATAQASMVYMHAADDSDRLLAAQLDRLLQHGPTVVDLDAARAARRAG